eukprot:gene13445-14827_t
MGQSYDGAPTMSGELNGVQCQIQRQFPFAYYNHCVAHRMSLCASRSANNIPRVATFFGTADKLITFFMSSPKRTRHLGYNLPKPGDTHWLSRDTAISVIDTHYETIGTVLYEIANNSSEKSETQNLACSLGMNIQKVEFLFLLKLCRKIFEHCTPIISTMQKSTLDAVMVASMLGDLKAVLGNFNFNQIWGDTLLADPAFPVIRERGGWRNMEQQRDGTQESWKQSLINLGSQITNMFGDQLSWRFSNLAKFRWMDLIHPAKFDERKKASSQEQRSLIEKLLQLYPFAVSDATATEYNLNVLYNNNEIALLLQKLVQERDAVVAQKNEKRARLLRAIQQRESNQESQDFEENDLFEPDENANIEPEAVKQGKANVQDLLS